MKIGIVKPDAELSALSDCDGEDYYEINVSDIVKVDIDEMANGYLDYIENCENRTFARPFSEYLLQMMKK